jgi:hypothetical protein
METTTLKGTLTTTTKMTIEAALEAGPKAAEANQTKKMLGRGRQRRRRRGQRAEGQPKS